MGLGCAYGFQNLFKDKKYLWTDFGRWPDILDHMLEKKWGNGLNGFLTPKMAKKAIQLISTIFIQNRV